MKSIKHNLNEELAIKLLGWKWIAYEGIPIRGTPGYPNKCRVRRLFPPSVFKAGRQWKEFFRENPYTDADMTEPLDYCYCSSNGPHPIPRFTILVEE